MWRMRCLLSFPSEQRAGSLAVACLLAAAVLLLAPLTASAEGDEIVEGGETFTVGDGPEPGMPSSNPRVKSMLAAHPNELVTICVAGCDSRPSIVQVLPKPTERRFGAMRTTAGSAARRPPYGVTEYSRPESDAVTCVAGCDGPPGEVLQRIPALPPPRIAPRTPEGMANEPLDVH